MKLVVDNLNITSVLTDGEKDIVSGLSFAVNVGEPLAIVGESGSGKTMTALALFGILPDNCRATGNLILDGINLLSLKGDVNKLRGRDMVYIPQNGADFLNPSLKIRTQMHGVLRRNGFSGGKIVLDAIARDRFDKVGLTEWAQTARKYPFQLSGGQSQRVVLAMSVVGNPKLVVADEPTKGIDEKTAAIFVDNLTVLFPNSIIVVITHDVSVAAKCQNVLVMKEGRAVEYGAATEVLQHPKHDYTKLLIDSLPQNLGGRK